MRGIKLSIRSLSRRKKDLFVGAEDEEDEDESGGIIVNEESRTLGVESRHGASEEAKESEVNAPDALESDMKDTKTTEMERNEPLGDDQKEMDETFETVLQSMRKRRKFIEKEPTGAAQEFLESLASVQEMKGPLGPEVLHNREESGLTGPKLHHLEHFLPPEERKPFSQSGSSGPGEPKKPELEIDDSNIGHQLLKKMGWQGKGLGEKEQGQFEPIAAKETTSLTEDGLEGESSDIYDAYRKRMMKAYQFRPNPLNNPRKKYY